MKINKPSIVFREFAKAWGLTIERKDNANKITIEHAESRLTLTLTDKLDDNVDYSEPMFRGELLYTATKDERWELGLGKYDDHTYIISDSYGSTIQDLLHVLQHLQDYPAFVKARAAGPEKFVDYLSRTENYYS